MPERRGNRNDVTPKHEFERTENNGKPVIRQKPSKREQRKQELKSLTNPTLKEIHELQLMILEEIKELKS